MDYQEVFNKAFIHCKTQGEPAIGNNSCNYYTYNGKRCAIGGIVSVEDAKKMSLNNIGVTADVHADILQKNFGDITTDDYIFLIKLQSAHDSAYHESKIISNDLTWLEAYEEQMVSIAEQYNLTIPC